MNFLEGESGLLSCENSNGILDSNSAWPSNGALITALCNPSWEPLLPAPVLQAYRMSDSHLDDAPGTNRAGAALPHSQKNVQQPLSAAVGCSYMDTSNIQQQQQLESGASEYENPLLKIHALSTQLLEAIHEYKGTVDRSNLFPSQNLINALLERKDYAHIITIYKNQISAVERMTSVGPAAGLHAPVRDSSNREERSNLSSCESSTEPRGPSQVPPVAKRRKPTREHPTPRVRAPPPAQPCTDDSGDDSGVCFQVPNRDDFFNFLVAHVRQNSSDSTPWSINRLKNAYTAAHPTHSRYKSWIGTINEQGRWSNGSWLTVQMILKAAFPSKQDHELESLMYTVGRPTVPATDTATGAPLKEPRKNRRYEWQEIYKFVIAQMKAKPSSETKQETCSRLALEIKDRWPVKLVKADKAILKTAWVEVQKKTPDAKVLSILKAQKISRESPTARDVSRRSDTDVYLSPSSATRGSGGGEPPDPNRTSPLDPNRTSPPPPPRAEASAEAPSPPQLEDPPPAEAPPPPEKPPNPPPAAEKR